MGRFSHTSTAAIGGAKGKHSATCCLHFRQGLTVPVGGSEPGGRGEGSRSPSVAVDPPAGEQVRVKSAQGGTTLVHFWYTFGVTLVHPLPSVEGVPPPGGRGKVFR